MRVVWSGAGLSLPWRLCRPGPLRWSARQILDDPAFARRAAELAAWAKQHDGTERGAELVERLATGDADSSKKLRGWDSNPQPFG
jgi:UDP:flavonoid glycosyltransferase YjiC (YdhE family)